MKTQYLDDAIARTGRLVAITESARALFTAAAALLTTGVLALLADAVLALAPSALAAVDALLAALCIAAGVWVVWQVAPSMRGNRRQVARLIEERLNVKDSRLINAVDLSESDRSGAVGDAANDGTSGELRQLSVDEGNALAAQVSPPQVVDGRPMRLAMLAAGVWALAIALALVVAPGLFSAVVPRYLHPFSDLPPYTLIAFDVQIKPVRVYYGKPAVIWANLSGADLPEQANVVFIDDGVKTTAPMLRSDAGKFVLDVSRAERSRRFYVQTPKGRSDYQDLQVFPVPLFERVMLKYEPPNYTHRPASLVGLGGDGIRNLQGTIVTVTVKSNVPLQFGRLRIFQPDQTQPRVSVPMIVPPGQPDTLMVRFGLALSGRFQISMVAADGTPVDKPLEGAIVAVPDKAPRVRFEQPGMEVIAVENWKVPIVIGAQDDVAVSRLALHRGVNGLAAATTLLDFNADQPWRVSADTQFDLGKLGARPSDVITYYATAYDNFPKTPHFTDTQTYTIRVISEEEYLAYARSKVRMDDLLGEVNDFQRQLDELNQRRDELLKELEALKKKIEANGGVMSDEDRRRLAEIEKQLADYAKQAAALAQKMRQRAQQPKLYEFEQQFNDSLKDAADDLDKQAQEAQRLLDDLRNNRRTDPQNADAHARQFMKDAGEQLQRDGQQMQKADENMKMTDEAFGKLQMADQMMGLAQRIAGIADQQRDLADRLGQFRGRQDLTPDEQRHVQRMAQEQADLKRDLEESLKQLQDAADKAQNDLPKMSASARDIAKRIGDMGVTPDQTEAQRAAEAGQHDAAHQSADSAAQKLASMIDQTDAMPGEATDDLDGKLSLSRAQLSQGLKQLSQGRQMQGLSSQSGPSSGSRGSMGSMAKAALMGPHAPKKGDRSTLGGRKDGTGPGQASDAADGGAGAEALTPDAAAQRAGAPGGMAGVPVKWRDKAAAYFRALAKDQP